MIQISRKRRGAPRGCEAKPRTLAGRLRIQVVVEQRGSEPNPSSDDDVHVGARLFGEC
jgi:hypothetical protein